MEMILIKEERQDASQDEIHHLSNDQYEYSKRASNIKEEAEAEATIDILRKFQDENGIRECSVGIGSEDHMIAEKFQNEIKKVENDQEGYSNTFKKLRMDFQSQNLGLIQNNCVDQIDSFEITNGNTLGKAVGNPSNVVEDSENNKLICEKCLFLVTDEENLRRHLKENPICKIIGEVPAINNSKAIKKRKKINNELDVQNKRIKLEVDILIDETVAPKAKKSKLKICNLKGSSELCDNKKSNTQLNLIIEGENTKKINFGKSSVKSNRQSLKLKLKSTKIRTKIKLKTKQYIKKKLTKKMKVELYSCTQCKVKCESEVHLKKHIDCVHLKIATHKCDICDFAAIYRDGLRRHMNNAHPPEEDDNKDEIFNSPRQLRAKKLITYIVKDEDDFKREIKKPTGRKLKECPQCGIKCGKLKRHMDSVHLKIEKFKCNFCDFKSVYNFQLISHVKKSHSEVDLESIKDLCAIKKSDLTPLKDFRKQSDTSGSEYTCDICEYHTNVKQYLKRHILRKHFRDKENSNVPRKRFSCDHCDFKGKSSIEAREHKEAFHPERVEFITCEEESCEFKSTSPVIMKRHVNNIHKKKFECDSCEAKFGSKSRLQRHYNGFHLKLRSTTCHLCTKFFSSNSHLKKHIEATHLKITRFNCHLCDYKAYAQEKVRTHINNVHLKIKMFTCSHCDYKTSYRRSLRVHIDVQHLNLRRYPCPKCDYAAATKTSLKLHINAIHLKRKPFPCNQCSYQATTKGNLQKHLDIVHYNIKPFTCNYCNYRTGIRKSLLSHVKNAHSDNVSLCCDYETNCGYIGSSNYDLMQHIEIVHLDANPFKCKQCEFAAPTKGKLTVHIKETHGSEDEDFSCDECGYKCSLATALLSHIEDEHLFGEMYECDKCEYEGPTKQSVYLHINLIHNPANMLQCGHCEYQTTSKSNLKVHTESVHMKIVRFKCIECNYGSYLKSSLKMHIEAVHQDKEHVKILENSIANTSLSSVESIPDEQELTHEKFEDPDIDNIRTWLSSSSCKPNANSSLENLKNQNSSNNGTEMVEHNFIENSSLVEKSPDDSDKIIDYKQYNQDELSHPLTNNISASEQYPVNLNSFNHFTLSRPPNEGFGKIPIDHMKDFPRTLNTSNQEVSGYYNKSPICSMYSPGSLGVPNHAIMDHVNYYQISNMARYGQSIPNSTSGYTNSVIKHFPPPISEMILHTPNNENFSNQSDYSSQRFDH